MINQPPPSTWVVIPTYWGPAGGALYDHPTPLRGESTLPTLLDSLAAQQNAPEFSVLVLVSAVGPEWEASATARVRQLLAPYKDRLRLALADVQTARALGDCLAAAGFDIELTGMRGYATVRNMQLLVPAALGAEAIIALDDDEVVAPGFVRAAMEFIGAQHDGQQIVGIAGLYADAQGEILLPEPRSADNLLLDKAIFMNQAFRQFLDGPDRLSATPMALGGNMVFHRDLFTRIGFDPGITRGEDIDYLINARLAGVSFLLDRELIITHLPPRHYESPAYGKMRQDVLRFVYEREKLRIGGLGAEAFDPYPGRLLRDELLEHALAALEATATPELAAQFGAPSTLLAEAQQHAQQMAPRYREFAERWPRMMEAVIGDGMLQEKLLRGAELPAPPRAKTRMGYSSDVYD
ncbi:MAG: glycosyltransferase family 2 protein [Anaerolineales bacterium]